MPNNLHPAFLFHFPPMPRRRHVSATIKTMERNENNNNKGLSGSPSEANRTEKEKKRSSCSGVVIAPCFYVFLFIYRSCLPSDYKNKYGSSKFPPYAYFSLNNKTTDELTSNQRPLLLFFFCQDVFVFCIVYLLDSSSNWLLHLRQSHARTRTERITTLLFRCIIYLLEMVELNAATFSSSYVVAWL